MRGSSAISSLPGGGDLMKFASHWFLVVSLSLIGSGCESTEAAPDGATTRLDAAATDGGNPPLDGHIPAADGGDLVDAHVADASHIDAEDGAGPEDGGDIPARDSGLNEDAGVEARDGGAFNFDGAILIPDGGFTLRDSGLTTRDAGVACDPSTCGTRTCGRNECGASCGECEVGFYCGRSGTCVDSEANPPPGTMCIDAFGLQVVEGASSYRYCPINRALLQRCTCGGGGISDWVSCGRCSEVVLEGERGDRCATDSQCSDPVPCHPTLRFCGERCDRGTPGGCPTGTACGRPGDTAGVCLPECATCGATCDDGKTCRQAESANVCVPSGYVWPPMCI